MKNICKMFMLSLLLTFITLTITSCGRYSKPYPVEGSGFPHQYPNEQE
ncbi:MAG: hypothetical protein IKN71_08650 [Alphaproteobacteria bacterium]|jgi:hypothetical protein|nr:hypothetical protein [Alphaproteobacteria bacterium]